MGALPDGGQGLHVGSQRIARRECLVSVDGGALGNVQNLPGFCRVEVAAFALELCK